LCYILFELGGEEEFCKFVIFGFGVILDIVLNHMFVGDESLFWCDKCLWEMVYDVDLCMGFYCCFFDIGELGGVK